jgi:uncharacterized membrane protein
MGAPPAEVARWHASAVRRVVTAFGAGIAIALPVAALTSWWLLPLLAWDFACVVYVCWVWGTIWRRDAASTARIAVRVDPTRAVADVLVQAAAIASLAAVGVVLVAHPPEDDEDLDQLKTVPGSAFEPFRSARSCIRAGNETPVLQGL